VLLIKGITLSMQLYDDPLIRETYDIDLLVDPEDRNACADLLRELGCAPLAQEGLSDRKTAIRNHFNHDEKFVHAGTGVMVELHHKLSNNDAIIETDFATLWARRATVQIGELEVATLGEGDLVYYLGIHAARHGWERWKWAADLAVLFRRLNPRAFAALHETARTRRTQSLVNSWILLVHAITGCTPADEVMAVARADRYAAYLMRSAMAISSREHSLATIDGYGDMPRALLHRLTLSANPRYLARELCRLFYREEDWRNWRLPDPLLPLYYVLRPFTLLWRRLGRLVSRLLGRGTANRSDAL
jgi:hypothetical protein